MDFPKIITMSDNAPGELVVYLYRSDVHQEFARVSHVTARRDHHYLVQDVFVSQSRDVKISFVQVAEGGQEKGHVHHRSQVVILWVKGEGTLETRPYVSLMRPGDVRFVPRGAWHRIKAAAGAAFISVQNPPIYDDETGGLDYVEEMGSLELLTSLDGRSIRGCGLWVPWAKQRWLMAEAFWLFVHNAGVLADRGRFEALALVLQANALEEGGGHGEESHAVQRRDFFTLLGERVGQSIHPSGGTASHGYMEILDRLVADRSLGAMQSLAMVGAVLYIEATIPTEFRLVREQCEVACPDCFRPKDNAGKNRVRHLRNRRYLDGHIEHDPRHLKELLDVLTVVVDEPGQLAAVLHGFNALRGAKEAFYALLGSRPMS